MTSSTVLQYILLTICVVLSDTLSKNTPTDVELAVQVDDSRSNVRMHIHHPPILSCIITCRTGT